MTRGLQRIRPGSQGDNREPVFRKEIGRHRKDRHPRKRDAQAAGDSDARGRVEDPREAGQDGPPFLQAPEGPRAEQLGHESFVRRTPRAGCDSTGKLAISVQNRRRFGPFGPSWRGLAPDTGHSAARVQGWAQTLPPVPPDAFRESLQASWLSKRPCRYTGARAR